jgi:hypothetical protein
VPLKAEWGVLLRGLDRLQKVETEQEGKHFVLRAAVTSDVGASFGRSASPCCPTSARLWLR